MDNLNTVSAKRDSSGQVKLGDRSMVYKNPARQTQNFNGFYLTIMSRFFRIFYTN